MKSAKTVHEYLEQLRNSINVEQELTKLAKLKWYYKTKKKKTIYLNISEAIARFEFERGTNDQSARQSSSDND